ncbi:hypothetical protein B5X24_HaOG215105 [Helicoverpa armigera]|nr:hypothetical protein B5X24_HaOG215105 [Helicoverpa armigera]
MLGHRRICMCKFKLCINSDSDYYSDWKNSFAVGKLYQPRYKGETSYILSGYGKKLTRDEDETGGKQL